MFYFLHSYLPLLLKGMAELETYFFFFIILCKKLYLVESHSLGVSGS